MENIDLVHRSMLNSSLSATGPATNRLHYLERDGPDSRNQAKKQPKSEEG